MIKYINRIIYALLAALGLMLVFNLTDTYARTLFLEEQGAIAIENNDYAYFISVRFYDEVPLVEETITISDRSFDLMIYQAAYIQLVNETYVVHDGLYIMMHQIAGESLNDFFTVRISSGTEITKDFMGVKIFSLSMYSVLDEDTQASLLKKSVFESDSVFQTITNITIFQDNDELIQIPVDIEETQFTVKADIIDYIDFNGSAPDEAFGNVTMAPIIEIDTRPIVFRNIAIYIVFAIGVTVLIFTARKRLGKKEPTIGVKQDIEKLEEQDRKER